jgi:phosphoribosyl 1,2-cyclic phosphodiesterase
MHEGSVTILSSGSCGNSVLVSDGESAIMIDAGLSCKELERRMSAYGFEPSQVLGLLLTHEHTDHTRGARRFCSRHHIPVHGTDGTLALTPLGGVRPTSISSKKAFDIAGFRISPFPVKHYAAEPVAFSLTTNGSRISIASDLGCVTPRVMEAVRSSDILLIEANYDDEMLINGSYPDFLKRTIQSDHGHLSNKESAMLCAAVVAGGTRRIVLVHLSKENNTSELATETVTEAVRTNGGDAEVDAVEHGASKAPISLR